MGDKEEQDIAIGMLQRTEKDLKVFKRNYRKKDFAHALFNMQQAVEKLGKSVLLIIEQCTEGDLANKIKHRLVDYIVKIIRKKLDEIVAINPELESVIREIIDKFQSDYKKKYRLNDDLYIEFEQLKILLKDYASFDTQIRTGTMLMINNFPMQAALQEWFESTEEILEEVEHHYDVKLTNEQRLEAKNKVLDYVISGQYFRELQNTLFVVLILSYVTILSVNLEKHVSSSRYDVREEDRYSKKGEIVKLLPLMNKTMKKMIDTYYYLISLNIEKQDIY